MLRNILSNWGLALLQIVVLVQLTPVQVRALGEAGQGAWLTIASLTSILSLLILGVPMASVRFIADHVAREEHDRANEIIATCIAICLGMGAAATMVGAGLSFFFERSYLDSPEWRSLGPEVLADARMAYWIAVLQMSVGFAAQLPFGILDAHHYFVGRNTVKIIGLLMRVALVVGVLRLRPSLVAVALIQFAIMAAEFGTAMLIIRKRFPHVVFGLRGVVRGRVREILSFSVFAVLLGIGAQLSFQSDQLVIGANASPEEGTFFDVGNKFFPALTGIVLGIGLVVMPMAAKLRATGGEEELRGIFLKWSKAAYSIALLVGAFLIVLAPEFITWWMGPRFGERSSGITRILMVAFILFLPVRGVASPILMGLNRPRQASLSLLAMGAINLALSLLLVRPFGIIGVAIGTAIPCVLYAVAVAIFACRALGVGLLDYTGYVFGRATLGVVIPVGVLMVMKPWLASLTATGAPWSGVLGLGCAGVAMSAAFVAVWVFFVYRGDPYVNAAAKVQRFLPAPMRRWTS